VPRRDPNSPAAASVIPALQAAGFLLRDRLSGLFLYGLSYLETLPRIFSFLVLGSILMGVP
jgi:uncharacterized membrane protein